MSLRKVFAGLLLALLVSWLPALQARAADGDEVDSYRIGYVVSPDGVLHVTETIVYRFGSESGRHGIYRDLVVREPYRDDQTKDQRYAVSQVAVTSPSGASAELTQQSLGGSARSQVLRLRIGSADQTVEDDTATYVIRYQVRGALRHFKDHSELYWDATGSAWQAHLHDVSVTATVPGGVTKVACFAGKLGSKASCATHKLTGGKAVFAQPSVPAGQQLTIVAAIRAGKVRNDTPLLVPAPAPEPTEEPTDEPSDEIPPDELPPDIDEDATDDGATPGVLAGAAAAVILLPAGAAVHNRRNRRDERYAGLPPGTVPPSGQNVAVGKNTLADDQLPVVFAPPPVPVAEAGLLVDGELDTTETAATLVDLAVRGAVRIDSDGPTAVLVDAGRAEHDHEQVLLTRMFGDKLEPESTRALGRAKTGQYAMRSAHVKMLGAVRDQVAARGWYTRLPADGSPSSAGCIPVTVMAFIGVVVAWMVAQGTARIVDGLLIGVAVIIAGICLYQVLKARARGARSAAGRAVTDQLIGFRRYLSTAEADQLRFEEGEDIFGRYLPWAIVFGIVDRWRQVCAELVAAGRIPAETTWYTGPSYVDSALLVSSFNGLAQSFEAPPSPPSTSSGNSSSFSSSSFGMGGGGGSSSGFSSGSSDGGSAGGGGGGGGGGSW